MSRYSSFVSKALLILTWITGNSLSLPVKFSFSLGLSYEPSLSLSSYLSCKPLLDLFLGFVSVSTVAIFSHLRSDKSSINADDGACFLELSRTGDNFLVLGRLTGEDKDARKSWCSSCYCFFALLVLLCRFLRSFFGERVPFILSFLPGINHLGVIY